MISPTEVVGSIASRQNIVAAAAKQRILLAATIENIAAVAADERSNPGFRPAGMIAVRSEMHVGAVAAG